MYCEAPYDAPPEPAAEAAARAPAARPKPVRFRPDRQHCRPIQATPFPFPPHSLDPLWPPSRSRLGPSHPHFIPSYDLTTV